MAKSKAPKSWAEQLADLEDPAPKGWYDPVIIARSRPDMLQSLIPRTMRDISMKRVARVQLVKLRT